MFTVTRRRALSRLAEPLLFPKRKKSSSLAAVPSSESLSSTRSSPLVRVCLGCLTSQSGPIRGAFLVRGGIKRRLHASRPDQCSSTGGQAPSSPPGGGQAKPGSGSSGGGGPTSSSGSSSGSTSSNRDQYRATQILHQGTVMYEDLERNIMKKISATNQSRFRIGFATSLLGLVWVVSTFGKQIRSFFSRHTAEVAKETLQNEALQIQTRELSAAVVQFILNDPEVLSRSTSFLKQAADNPETQDALVALVRHVFTHPETLDVLKEMGQRLVTTVLNSKESLDEVSILMAKVIQDPRVKAGVVQLLSELTQDPDVYQAVLELSHRILADEGVQASISEMLIKSSHRVLEDDGVIDHSKVFVAEVVTDDSVQRTGGDALWNSLQYSFQPRLIKVMWFGLLCGVVAFVRMSGNGA